MNSTKITFITPSNLNAARLVVLQQRPWLRSFMTQVLFVESPDIEDRLGGVLAFNHKDGTVSYLREWAEEASVQDIASVLYHELMHGLVQHAWDRETSRLEAEGWSRVGALWSHHLAPTQLETRGDALAIMAANEETEMMDERADLEVELEHAARGEADADFDTINDSDKDEDAAAIERARIVAWLREQKPAGACWAGVPPAVWADAIERGDDSDEDDDAAEVVARLEAMPSNKADEIAEHGADGSKHRGERREEAARQIDAALPKDDDKGPTCWYCGAELGEGDDDPDA